ncbi:GIY-YIG nuclease family protein [Chroococcidiopsis sp. FACHB-1243]|uniref:GIY-YIG nuclease family protein n=1 Tax=Chroococcidiopsis sp. [FACHB-1243] TaxID=2692781 RepID=UPI00178666F3|nr:GIY-YIG nuclease family protein [Chroococcidiopsis sp. [FACHB-1243]]MBD2304451.1 GIY-YIG nuclease family protein [Chroococcidiopsis sp. [FACHB-1243]]
MTPLTDLAAIPYIDTDGQLPAQYQGKVGVYAIFDSDKVLQYIGYSRDVYLSLQQHLVRQPQKCYWLKIQTIDRPSRSVLENIRQEWIEENGSVPPGNGADETIWTQPIDAKLLLTSEEQKSLADGDELAQIKILKTAARRVEAEISSQLQTRGLQMQLRFNPKLKEQGLLDLK